MHQVIDGILEDLDEAQIGECTCNHCQMDTMIDSLSADYQAEPQSNHGRPVHQLNMKEVGDDSQTVPVYHQLALTAVD